MHDKTIVLGVSGGIAAYKACDLASKLTQRGAEVHVVMTASAQRFVTPLTFQALTHQPVHTSLWPENNEGEAGVYAAMAHIGLADRADAVIIAPASANIIARLATGLADDLLSTLALATRAPVLVSPAMNPSMLDHPATRRNIALLRDLGYLLVEPETGRMACEHIGSGRLPATDVLIQRLCEVLGCQHENIRRPTSDSLLGKKVLVTAGPTREALDPVRYISNRSSGKMGFAIAEEANLRGAAVMMVSGPSQLPTPPGVLRIDVTTTEEMYRAVLDAAPACDIIIGAAAPADYRAAAPAAQKLKKEAAPNGLKLELMPTADIIAAVGCNKRAGQIVIGFAAETTDLLGAARRKLASKGLDAVVANDVTEKDAGFDVDTNRVFWVTADYADEWPLMTKQDVAARIMDEVEKIGRAAGPQ